MAETSSKSSALEIIKGLVLGIVIISILSVAYTHLWFLANYLLNSEAAQSIQNAGGRSRYSTGIVSLLFLVVGVLLPIGYGTVCGSLMGTLTGSTEDEKPVAAILAAGIFAIYASWISWFYFTNGELLLAPWSLLHGISNLMERGIPFGRRVRHSFELYVPWIIESVFILGGTFYGWGEKLLNKKV